MTIAHALVMHRLAQCRSRAAGTPSPRPAAACGRACMPCAAWEALQPAGGAGNTKRSPGSIRPDATVMPAGVESVWQGGQGCKGCSSSSRGHACQGPARKRSGARQPAPSGQPAAVRGLGGVLQQPPPARGAGGAHKPGFGPERGSQEPQVPGQPAEPRAGGCHSLPGSAGLVLRMAVALLPVCVAVSLVTRRLRCTVGSCPPAGDAMPALFPRVHGCCALQRRLLCQCGTRGNDLAPSRSDHL